MALETVAVTGGSGLLGRAILTELTERGYRTANLDRVRPDEQVADEFLYADLTDPGETFGALARVEADAVAHMGTITNPVHHPGHVTFESNAMSTYHVLEAAAGLEFESVCIASSINAMGFNFQAVPPEIEYLPLDEAHPTTPRDPYALGKRTAEVLADGFGRQDRRPRTISTMRFPAVYSSEAVAAMADDDRTPETVAAMADDDRSLEAMVDRDAGDHWPSFSYLHVGDGARAVRLALEADFSGHETFWIAAADSLVDVPTRRLCEAFYPDAEVRDSIEDHASLLSTEKARDVLGWEPEHSWRE